MLMFAFIDKIGFSNQVAPRVGRDSSTGSTLSATTWFQSTRPARGATLRLIAHAIRDDVSIHAPREGRDHGWHLGFGQ